MARIGVITISDGRDHVHDGIAGFIVANEDKRVRKLEAASEVEAADVDLDVTGWNRPDHVVHPSGSSTYQDFYEKYRALYPATANVAHFLAERQLAAEGENRGQGS